MAEDGKLRQDAVPVGTAEPKPAGWLANVSGADSTNTAGSGQQSAAGVAKGGGAGSVGSKAANPVLPKASIADKKADRRQNKKYEDLVQFLEKVPLMKRLPRDQIPIFAANCEIREFYAESNIITQGDMGHEFFVISKGEAAVYIAAEDSGRMDKVNELHAGDFFGDNSLIWDEPRKATITATSDIECLSITREKFQELGLHNKLHFPKRQAVGMGIRQKEVVKKEPTPKSADDRALIAEALKRNEDLQAMVSLDDDRIQRMIDVAWKEEFEAGDSIITEGDLDADYFYVVQEGSAAVASAADASSPIRRSKSTRSADEASGGRTLEKGDSFGELALLYVLPRSATVTAEEKCTLWVFDRDSFKMILMRASEEQIQENMRLLGNVDILDTLTKWEKRQMAEALVEMHFVKGETVLQQGATDTGFYIMREGQVAVSVGGREVRQLEVTSSKGEVQFFGEKALLKNEPRSATVEVISEKAIMFVLDRDTFELVLRPLEDIIRNSRQGRRPTAGDDILPLTEEDKAYALMRKSLSAKASSGGEVAPDARLPRKKIEQDELTKIGLLGVGGFGSVELFEHKQTGETYAMKAMSKGFIVKQHMTASIVNEKRILSLMDSPFIIKLYGTYNLPQDIQFLMEPALGGELYATYHKRHFHGLDGHARYYSAGVVCAFEYLHERRVVYRDLKPENLLLNELGHLKLTDMGLAKFILGRTYTTCGTPDYFAPEVIASAGHNRAVDWWCLGVLLFELLSGHPPFESNSPMHIYAKVRKGIGKVIFPPKCQGDVGDLIRGLLQSNPSDRLPMRQGGVDSMKKHPWYVNSDFNWEEHYSGKMIAPYQPEVKTKTDISNFRPRKEDAPPKVNWKDDGSGWDQEF